MTGLDRRAWPVGTLLHRLSPRARDDLLERVVRQAVRPNAVLVREGEISTHVLLILGGFVKVTVSLGDGREALIDIRVAGDLVGELAALNGEPRSGTVSACGRVVVGIIQRAALRAFLVRQPEAGLQLTAIVADRLRLANQRRADFMSHPATARLARVLSELAAVHGHRVEGGIEIGVPLVQSELGALCGTGGGTAQRSLRELRERGLIDTGYRRIVVHDLEALRRAGDPESAPP